MMCLEFIREIGFVFLSVGSSRGTGSGPRYRRCARFFVCRRVVLLLCSRAFSLVIVVPPPSSAAGRP